MLPEALTVGVPRLTLAFLVDMSRIAHRDALLCIPLSRLFRFVFIFSNIQRKNKAFSVIFSALFLSIPDALASPHNDSPVYMFKVDQLEYQDADGDDPTVLEGEAWYGTDLNKVWLKTDAEYVSGEFEEAEIQLLYSRAIAPFWDLQLGLRHDFKPTPERTWAAMTLQGLAPGFVEVESEFFFGEQGQTQLRVTAEYELLLTQKWIISPEIELSAFGRNDQDTGVGAGFSDVTAGLRLRYEIRREFTPYIGIEWFHKYGKTADFAEQKGEEKSDTRLVVGIRFWF